MRWLGLVALAMGCTTPAPEPAPAPAPASASASASALAPASEAEALELDFQVAPFEADLDGDGKAERITFACGESLVVTVGSARISEPLGLAAIVGCSAAVLPTAAGPLLLVTADEHEEAGPDRHGFYRLAGGKLSAVWSGSADIEITAGGGWTTTTSDCDETAKLIITTRRQMRWDGASVKSDESVERAPLESDGCGDDP